MGRLGAEDHPRADGDRPRVRRRDRRGRLERQRLSSPATSSAAKATSSAAAAATASRAGGIFAPTRRASASTAPGAFAEYIALPMTNVWHHPRSASIAMSPRSSIRSAMRSTRRCRFGAGRRRADHRRRPDRHHGRGGRAATPGARFVVITDVNPYRLELAQEDGRHAGARMRASERSRDVQKELGMKEGFDVGLEMSGNPRRVPRHARQHVPRRQDRHARHPVGARSRSTGTPSSSTC